MDEKKYFQIAGGSEIRIGTNGDIELFFYDDDDNIINQGKPFVFDLEANGRLRFLSSVLLVGMTQPSFPFYEEVLNVVAPGIKWEGAEKPQEMRTKLMNPVKEPPGG